jgi:hypothetical protein
MTNRRYRYKTEAILKKVSHNERSAVLAECLYLLKNCRLIMRKSIETADFSDNLLVIDTLNSVQIRFVGLRIEQRF